MLLPKKMSRRTSRTQLSQIFKQKIFGIAIDFVCQPSMSPFWGGRGTPPFCSPPNFSRKHRFRRPKLLSGTIGTLASGGDVSSRTSMENHQQTVDGRNLANQLRLVVFPTIYKGLYIQTVVVWDSEPSTVSLYHQQKGLWLMDGASYPKTNICLKWIIMHSTLICS